jgi:hypothetical protein
MTTRIKCHCPNVDEYAAWRPGMPPAVVELRAVTERHAQETRRSVRR